MQSNLPSKELLKVSNFDKYLELLNKYKSQIIIIISSKDNIGKCLSDTHAVLFNRLGFKTSLKKSDIITPWRSLICVSWYGKKYFEKIGSPMHESIEYISKSISITSHVFKNGHVDNIKMIFNDTDYSPNLRGLNFVIIDKNEKIIDRVNFDTYVNGIICRRFHIETAELTESDQFIWLGKYLSNKMELNEHKKILFWPYANGDYYGACASLQYCEHQHNEEICVLTFHPKQEEILSWFSYDDYYIKYFRLSFEEYMILKREHYKELKTNQANAFHIIFLRLKPYVENQILSIHAIRFGEKLRQPRFPTFNSDKYIAEYGIVQGKTILIVPIAEFVKSLPDKFWNLAAMLFESIGYTVLFNVPQKDSNRFVSKCIFPPLEDAVGLADLCGHVFSVRTGFLDFISSSKARFTVFQPKDCSQFDKEFRIENTDKRIKTYYYDESDLFLEKTFILKLFSDYSKPVYLKPLFPSKNISHSEYYKANIQQTRTFNKFSYRFVNKETSNHTPLLYTLSISESDGILLNITVDNYSLLSKEPFDIVTVFINENNKTISSQYHNLSMIKYIPEVNGLYKAKITLTNMNSGIQEEYITKSILYTERTATSIDELATLKSLDTYVQSLYYFRKDLVIILSTRDTHTTETSDGRASILKALSWLGISKDLAALYRHSFISIIDGGNIIVEANSQTRILEKDYILKNGSNVHVVSKGYSCSKSSDRTISICVNRKEYSMNCRGLNIVAWDKENNCLVDSIVIDVFSNNRIKRCTDFDVPSGFNGAKWFDDVLCPFTDGEKDNSFTGVKTTIAGNDVYFKNGIVQSDFSGFIDLGENVLRVEKGIVREVKNA